jgi:hypothetical protein
VALSVESSYACCCEHVFLVAGLVTGGRAVGTHRKNTALTVKGGFVKHILFVLAMLVAGKAEAQQTWTPWFEKDSSVHSYRVESSTDSVVIVWRRMNHVSLGVAEVRVEYKCAERIGRTIGYVGYDASGRFESADSDVEAWEPVTPDTYEDLLFKAICPKR